MVLILHVLIGDFNPVCSTYVGASFCSPPVTITLQTAPVYALIIIWADNPGKRKLNLRVVDNDYDNYFNLDFQGGVLFA